MEQNEVMFFEDSRFYGSETFYRTTLLRSLVATEGIKYMFDTLACYWVGDFVMTCLPVLSKLLDSAGTFFVVKVVRNENNSATLTVDDGNENFILSKHIQYTDLSQNLKFYLIYDTVRWTMLLPSEY